MSKSPLTLVFHFLGLAFIVLGAVNFMRLDHRTVPPTASEYATYVGLPALVAVVITAYISLSVLEIVRDNGRPGEPPVPSPVVPSPSPTISDPTALKPVAPDNPATNRTHVWAILDELSEQLRDDAEASEALFTVRERFHKLQFAPTEDAA